jgi:hypothetical protein
MLPIPLICGQSVIALMYAKAEETIDEDVIYANLEHQMFDCLYHSLEREPMIEVVLACLRK